MRRRGFQTILLLLVGVAIAAGVAALASVPESPPRDDPPASGDHARVTLQVAGMT